MWCGRRRLTVRRMRPVSLSARLPSAGAGTGMDPEFRIQNSIPLITDGEVDTSDGSLVLPVKTDTGDPADAV